MPRDHPCGGIGRRHFLGGLASLPLLAGAQASGQVPRAADHRKEPQGKLGAPGPYPGRVIEVRNPSMIKNGVKNREEIKKSLGVALTSLTGAEDPVDGWRTFFEPGDVVGIKVVPNGYPLAYSSPELVLEVIDGLKAAGVKARDMIVFDRYTEELLPSRLQEALPAGMIWGGLTPQADGSQLRQSWPGNDPVAGYDPDEFVEMNLVHHGADLKDDRNFRSHLALLVTRKVNKLVMLPVIKDHGSAGVTGALKNMSHGLVNNVARSHSTPDTNVCNQFIPAVASHPIIRRKCVLQIMDGIRAIYQGGPFSSQENAHWAWEYNALLVATDPVALDHVEWDIIDAKRKAMGLAPVGAVGRLGQDAEREGFDIRQPQHIRLAANLGLGIFDHKSPLGKRFQIDHRVVPVA
jgi:uncharacterized protein (DUF362 family)